MRDIKVSDVAEMLGVSPQSIRIGLQRNLFNFGVAFKSKDSNKVFNYIIYPQKVIEVVGEDRFNKVMEDRYDS